MLLKDKNKSLPTLILRKMESGEEKMKMRPESAGAELAESEDLYMVADDLMEAIKSSDVRKLKEAMEAFVECCMNKEKESYESDDYDD